MTNNDREDKNMSETTTMPRFDLIDAEIEWAEAEEAKGEMSAWNQQNWAKNDAPCGTAYCLAGHVVAQSGARLNFNGWLNELAFDAEHDMFGYRQIPDLANMILDLQYGHKLAGEGPDEEDFLTPEGVDWVAYETAEEEWDTRTAALDLYNANNTIDDLKRIRDNLAEHYGHPTKWR